MGKRTFTERARLAAQGEAVGEEVENLVFLHLSPRSHHARQIWGAKGVAFSVGVGASTTRFKGNSNFVEKMGRGPHFLR